MQLIIKGKQMDVGDALKTHVAQNLNNLVSKYFDHPMDGTVLFAREAHLYRADIHVRVGHNILLHSVAEATEPYPAFDLAADKLSERLRRHKSRLRDHHRKEMDGQISPYFILQAEMGEGTNSDSNAYPPVVAEMTTPIENLTVSEAVMRLDLANLPALMFRNKSNGGLNMVYRRNDGNIGWVDPSNPKASATK